MQMTRRMKNADAKKYVADKLGIALSDLTDAAVMGELRADKKLGTVYSSMGSFKGIEAKRNVAEVLGIEINCLERFRERFRQ